MLSAKPTIVGFAPFFVTKPVYGTAPFPHHSDCLTARIGRKGVRNRNRR